MSFDLGGICKLAGQVIGGMIGGPVGSMIGSMIGDMVGQMITNQAGDSLDSSGLSTAAQNIFNANYSAGLGG